MPTYTQRRYRNRPQRDKLAELEQWLQADESHRTAYTYLYAQVMERTDGRSAPQFFVDLLTKARRYGNLTPNQLAAVLRSIERDAEHATAREAERVALKDVAPVATGRRAIVGEVVSVRVKHTQYGWTPKMVVREADGNKVWGSVPRDLWPSVVRVIPHDGTAGYRDMIEGEEAYPAEPGDTIFEQAIQQRLVGTTVHLHATVTRSDTDEHFGFFKRPTADRVAGPPAATVRLP